MTNYWCCRAAFGNHEDSCQNKKAEKDSRQVTVRTGAMVWKDFGLQRRIDEDRVFAATEISPDRCKLVAHGYGILGEGSSAYGNGAIYVNLSDLIEITKEVLYVVPVLILKEENER